MSGEASPNVQTVERVIAAVAQGADAEIDLTEAAFAGTVTKVEYVPATTITGANTDYRTIQVVNKGQLGAGATVVASKSFTSGVNAPGDDNTAITLSGTAANLVVAAGDVLVLQSNHVGAGLADPGGLVHIEISRTAGS